MRKIDDRAIAGNAAYLGMRDPERFKDILDRCRTGDSVEDGL
jgi:hypothetical protein